MSQLVSFIERIEWYCIEQMPKNRKKQKGSIKQNPDYKGYQEDMRFRERMKEVSWADKIQGVDSVGLPKSYIEKMIQVHDDKNKNESTDIEDNGQAEQTTKGKNME